MRFRADYDRFERLVLIAAVRLLIVLSLASAAVALAETVGIPS
jgi:hypothetical protein